MGTGWGKGKGETVRRSTSADTTCSAPATKKNKNTLTIPSSQIREGGRPTAPITTPNGNPEYPYVPSPDERSFFDALDDTDPDVDWTMKAGEPHYRPINTTTRLRAAVGQRIGTLVTDGDGEACERCYKGLGPFASCKTVTIRGITKFRGSCMNCVFAGGATKCTLRTGQQTAPAARGAHVPSTTRVADGAISKPGRPPAPKGPRISREGRAVTIDVDNLVYMPSQMSTMIHNLRTTKDLIEDFLADQKLPRNAEGQVAPAPSASSSQSKDYGMRDTGQAIREEPNTADQANALVPDRGSSHRTDDDTRNAGQVVQTTPPTNKARDTDKPTTDTIKSRSNNPFASMLQSKDHAMQGSGPAVQRGSKSEAASSGDQDPLASSIAGSKKFSNNAGKDQVDDVPVLPAGLSQSKDRKTQAAKKAVQKEVPKSETGRRIPLSSDTAKGRSNKSVAGLLQIKDGKTQAAKKAGQKE
ncbi:hypothetical protein N7468_010193 [Penicillium chermesinum]|uniref:Uncharacterized protein n=1 Tax=Penicillium chermesinum TaxID=63820 RepID=A0A9W9NC75_9EURO|nr:uncharacterized protein N7468_010193 [Penicillium chermesinum]KAJ5217185.1 hypothetical protein N7468_010193 [Penicillium chermesinum]